VTIFDEEAARALLYREQWDAKIAFRSNQLRRFSGQAQAFDVLWENYGHIYRIDNFIAAFQSPEGGYEVPGEQGSYLVPIDIDDNGAISSTRVRVANTRHASDQNDRPHGG
jgi:hypothetical protein